MYEGNTVGAVIPAYNESKHIDEVIETLPRYVDRAYVVDDASTDDTWSVIQESVDRWRLPRTAAPVTDGGVPSTPRLVPIRHDQNQGVGGAIKTGYRRALQDRIDVTVVISGDGQMEPDIVEDVVAAVARGEADYAKGNRLRPGLNAEMPPFRRFGNYLLSGLTKVSSGYWHVMDPQNGCAAISLDALEAIDIDDLYDDFGFANDLLARLNEAEVQVADVPQRAIYKDEESHIQYRTFVPKVSVLLLRNFLTRLYRKYLTKDFHPLIGLYLVGAGTVVLALGWLLGSVLVSPGSRVFVSLVGLLTVGVVSTGLAMAFDARQNRELIPRSPTTVPSDER